jgi:hypothetical protein
MKIFISWSGQRSKSVAELISDWIKCVIQVSYPWISTRDIDRGAIWFSEINDQLKSTSAGIVCLTQENKNKPWILFETGALVKGLTTNRVCTFLVDLQPSDLEDPLAQFNHTMPEKGSMWGLVRSLNGCMNDQGLDERILEKVFETYWPQFEHDFNEALQNNPASENVEPRKESDILAEILNNTRYLNQRVRDIESRIEKDKRSDNYFVAPNKKMGLLKAGVHSNIVRDLVQKGLSDEEILNSDVLNDCPTDFIRTTLCRIREEFKISDDLKRSQII